MKGDLAIVQALCAAGADINAKGPGGKTALAVAREKRQMAIVQYLQQPHDLRESAPAGFMD